ncbi:MAG: hypothetical protein HY304_09460, partial [candidate division Zixibacteria bacterium]|nr:hypothetical protein [candidate division Zixibacteria bacterium]
MAQQILTSSTPKALDTHWASVMLPLIFLGGDRPMRFSVRFRFCFATLCVVLWARPAAALENSVVVESKTVVAGADSVWVAVFVNNSVPIYELDLPLELRSVTAGAFTRSKIIIGDAPAGRVHNSPLSDDSSNCWFPPWSNPFLAFWGAPNTVDNCSGPVSESYGGDASTNAPFVSPDAVLLTADGHYCGPLGAGQDPPSSDSASCYLVFDVTNIPGQFEIDTCCAWGHLSFGGGIVPSFTKGVITIRCDCSCHADPDCNGVTDIVDVIQTIDRAFRGAETIDDPSCAAHGASVDGRTDVNCSGATDLVDVVLMIRVAVRGEDPASVFCNACGQSMGVATPAPRATALL